MTYLFVGNEDHDFSPIGACTVDTATTAARRTSYSRCSLKVASAAPTDGWQGALSAVSSEFWLTARFSTVSSAYGFVRPYVISLLDGPTRRLVLTLQTGNLVQQDFWRLDKQNAANAITTLQTSTTMFPGDGSVNKIDVYVKYAVAGIVRVYIGGALIIDYSGDVTTDGATSLSSFVLGQASVYGPNYNIFWSEVIASTEDTRSMGLISVWPAANGNTFGWTGSYASVDEVTLDDTDVTTSSTANQLAQVTINTSGVTNNSAVRALILKARAAKGDTGPQNIQGNVRVAGTDYFTGTTALPVALAPIPLTFTTNPATGVAWTRADIVDAGFNIGLKSIT